MRSLKFYSVVFAVGALADVLANKAVQNSTTGMAYGLRQFYETASPLKTALFAGVTFVGVVFIADQIVSNI